MEERTVNFWNDEDNVWYGKAVINNDGIVKEVSVTSDSIGNVYSALMSALAELELDTES